MTVDPSQPGAFVEGGAPLVPVAPPGMLSARELARAVCLTKQSITNYSRDGMPHVMVEGRRFFDLAKCRKWIADNKRHVIEPGAVWAGGRRKGAGRKRKSPNGQMAKWSNEGGAGAVAGVVAGADGGAASPTAAGAAPVAGPVAVAAWDPLEPSETLPLMRAALDERAERAGLEAENEWSIARVLRGRTLRDEGVVEELLAHGNKADIDKLNAMLDGLRKDQAMRERRGELLARDAVIGVFRETLAAVLAAVDRLPTMLADQARIGLPPVAGDRGQSGQPMDAMDVARLRALAETMVADLRSAAAASLEQLSTATKQEAA
jgi:hypothetical protein